MIPTLEQAETAARFMSFLQNERESIEVNLCRFAAGRLEMLETTHKQSWPKKGILYP
jgi:hypothetical protein